eukprot:TRINITY_DN18334_c2_g2_i10.p1 TRINITY_DN18334_c2_g2~~TRINITY_DN18334_c2_g2_i10.p1  ORF type:complete len:194 (+),score=25.12 TRINITY_DN18334_c2_g2_i10:78-659(+)
MISALGAPPLVKKKKKKKISEDVILKRDVQVSGLNITSNGNIQNWIKIKLQNNVQITFENCNFDGVGIWVQGDNYRSGDVKFRNCKFSKTPSTGLVAYNLSSCYVSSVEVSDCGWNGIEVIETKECFMEDVHVTNSAEDGIYFLDTTKGEMKNCSMRNCEEYGVKVHNSKIIGYNVEFIDNKKGETFGNFIQK